MGKPKKALSPSQSRFRYLSGMFTANVAVAGFVFLSFVSGIALISILIMCVGGAAVLCNAEPAGCVRSLAMPLLQFAFIAGPPAAVFGFSVWQLRRIKLKINKMEYVSPVREQLLQLPADEILVRGADQPAVAPQELLRAAQSQAGDRAEVELLRSADVGQS